MAGTPSRAVRMTQTKFYLGAGVFVESRPDALVLTTEVGYDAVTNTIVLESAVLVNLFNLVGVPVPAHLKATTDG